MPYLYRLRVHFTLLYLKLGRLANQTAMLLALVSLPLELSLNSLVF